MEMQPYLCRSFFFGSPQDVGGGRKKIVMQCFKLKKLPSAFWCETFSLSRSTHKLCDGEETCQCNSFKELVCECNISSVIRFILHTHTRARARAHTHTHTHTHTHIRTHTHTINKNTNSHNQSTSQVF